jgi:hypothetical protein
MGRRLVVWPMYEPVDSTTVTPMPSASEAHLFRNDNYRKREIPMLFKPVYLLFIVPSLFLGASIFSAGFSTSFPASLVCFIPGGFFLVFPFWMMRRGYKAKRADEYTARQAIPDPGQGGGRI